MIETVSVIMPAYNAGETIDESIGSVVAQSFPDWKLYVIDDCSTDDTRKVVTKWTKLDPRIVQLSNKENLGVAEARNRGISNAQGKYLAFLDSDDTWLPNKLSKQLEVLRDGDYHVVCSYYQRVSRGRRGYRKVVKSPVIFTYNDMLNGNLIGNLTGIYNAEEIGKRFQRARGHEDYIFWLDIMRVAEKGFCVPEVLASYYVSGSSLSSDKLKAARWQWEIYQEVLGMNVFKSMSRWVQYCVRALLKR